MSSNESPASAPRPNVTCRFRPHQPQSAGLGWPAPLATEIYPADETTAPRRKE